MSKSAEYVRNEHECRALAAAARADDERIAWLQMAEKWARLKRSSLSGTRGDPVDGQEPNAAQKEDTPRV